MIRRYLPLLLALLIPLGMVPEANAGLFGSKGSSISQKSSKKAKKAKRAKSAKSQKSATPRKGWFIF